MLNNKTNKMNTQTNTQTNEDKILNFIDGPLTKILIGAVIVSLIIIVLYNGIILNGFSSGSWAV